MLKLNASYLSKIYVITLVLATKPLHIDLRIWPQSTLNYLFTLAMQHGGLWVSQGMVPSNSKAAVRDDPNYLGSYAGAMAQSPSDAGAGEMPAGDLRTARAFGQRVAEVAARYQR